MYDQIDRIVLFSYFLIQFAYLSQKGSSELGWHLIHLVEHDKKAFQSRDSSACLVTFLRIQFCRFTIIIDQKLIPYCVGMFHHHHKSSSFIRWKFYSKDIARCSGVTSGVTLFVNLFFFGTIPKNNFEAFN